MSQYARAAPNVFPLPFHRTMEQVMLDESLEPRQLKGRLVIERNRQARSAK